jgi:lipopolysaccharide transport system ATP-binding protein
MSDVVIRAERLSKKYRIGSSQAGYRTLRDAIVDVVTAPLHRLRAAFHGDRTATDEEIWALKDVSFEVRQGEVVGLIGRNGAGKSTLLKILSRITEPTSGRVLTKGRVGSLLEVGTGFHNELTGRENIYLSGAILGMRHAEIRAKFEEIVAFAEVEKFIDTPVKHFSTGMYLRLAFAVAAHLEPDILLVDEVLAVGDASFQKKCLGKMSEVAGAGRTVVFVSHDLGAIQTLTGTCLLLKGGELVAFGVTHAVVREYLEGAARVNPEGVREIAAFRRSHLEGSEVRFTSVSTDRDGSQSLPTIESGADFTIVLELESSIRVAGAVVMVALKNGMGQRVATIFSWDRDFSVDLVVGWNAVTLEVDGLPLAPGRYVADIGVNRSAHTVSYDVLLDVPLLVVADPPEALRWPDRPWGAVHWQDVRWRQAGSRSEVRPGT